MIEKLIAARAVADEYYTAMQFKGKKTQADVDRFMAGVGSLGLAGFDDFLELNLRMNLQEADRCIRFRRVDNPDQPAICDMCAGRSIVPCIQSCAGGANVGGPWIDGFNKYTPDGAFIAEQQAEASRLGVNIPFLITPIVYFLHIGNGETIHGYCIGRSVQIAEPRFNLLWGMEKYMKYGEVINANMRKANEVI